MNPLPFGRKARSIFSEIKGRNNEYFGKLVCYLNFYIPLLLKDVLFSESKANHLVLVSWRYSTFLNFIFASSNSSSEEHPMVSHIPKGENIETNTLLSGVSVLRESPITILEQGIEQALGRSSSELVCIIIPDSALLLKQIRALKEPVPANLVLIIDGNAFLNVDLQELLPGWNVSAFKGQDLDLITAMVGEIKSGKAFKPQLIVVDKPWEQILI